MGRGPRRRPYYEKYNRSSDFILRCFDCGRLALHTDVMANEGTTLCCGTRKLREVRALSPWEWLKVRFGLLDFQYRDEFLAEFHFPILRKLFGLPKGGADVRSHSHPQA